MNDELFQRINKIRVLLDSNPEYLIAGKLPKGNDSIDTETSYYCGYERLLKITDGPRCGIIDLWTLQELPKNQYLITTLPDNGKKRICIGQILYEPLVLECDGNLVYWVSVDDSIDVRRDLGTLDNFLNNVVFGAEYETLISDNDDLWLQILKRII